MNRTIKFAIVFLFAAIASYAWAQAAPSPAPDAASFAPFQQWVGAVLTGDAAALKALYSTDPPAQIRVKDSMVNADADLNFWIGMKVRSMKVEVIRTTTPRPEITHIIFRADIVTGVPDGKSTSVTDDHVWLKQGDQWRLASAERTDAPRLKQPSDMKKEIYPVNADAHAEIKEAEAKAASEHKRLLLVFGANWCGDCRALDKAMHGDSEKLIRGKFEVVKIDVGNFDKNLELAERYGNPIKKGIPAVVVLSADNHVIYSTKGGELANARRMGDEGIYDFLSRKVASSE